MYYREHGIPHFHAIYAGARASIAIETLEGSLPDRAVRFVRERAEMHRAEFEANWQLARDRQPLQRIDPLP